MQTSPALVIAASRSPTHITRHAQATLLPLITTVAAGTRHACRRRQLGATATNMRLDVGIGTRAGSGTVHYLGQTSRHSRRSGADERQRRHLALAEEDAEVGGGAGGAGHAGRGAGVGVLIFGARCAGGRGECGRVGAGWAGRALGASFSAEPAGLARLTLIVVTVRHVTFNDSGKDTGRTCSCRARPPTR